MDWEKLKLFQGVADAGSFTLAAKRLHVNQSSISRQVRALEDSLNVALFTRHARGLTLTPEGEELYRTAREVAEKIDFTEERILETEEKPTGPLRITTTHTFGSFWLTPRLKEFIRRYPDIQLELVLSDSVLDLSTREADVAIRFREPVHADLIQRTLVQVHHHIYGAPAYIHERGMPETLDDLDKHDLIVFGPRAPSPIKDIDWILGIGRKRGLRKPVLQVNSLFGVLQAVRKGIGISPIPDYLAASAPELVRILPDLDAPEFNAYLVYPQEFRRSKRLSVFRDYLINKVREDAEHL